MLDLFFNLLGLSPQTKMLVRLYALSIYFLLGSFFLLVFGDEPFATAGRSTVLSMVNQLAIEIAYYASLVCFGAFLITFSYSSFKFWKWHTSNEVDVCQICGGMTRELNGRFGPYYKCLACRNNRSIWR